jgi:UDP:flavonoid glycosyltransferase YjiC (YdhE family)
MREWRDTILRRISLLNPQHVLLLATWEGGGVIPPEMGLARRLLARGHEVHVLADPAVESSALAAGCSFSPWVTAPHKRSLAPEEDFLRDWEFKNPLSLFARFLDVFICGPAAKFAADTLAVLDRHPSDVLLADMNMLGAMLAAESREIPYAVLVPNIYLRPTPGIPPLGPGFMPARGPLGRLRDAIMRALGDRLWKKGLPPVNRARAELGLAPLEEIWAQYDRAEKVLVMTARAFDFEARSLPKNVEYVGPVLDDPSWAGASWSPPWPSEDRRPLVLVGLSSTYQDQHRVLANVVDALSALPVRALVTLGPALALDAMRSPSPNVVIVPTAPHGAVLQHASAVITHCGHGTTLRSLAAGLPLVCIPMGRDQNDTAARVVARDAGIRLKPTATPTAIRRAVEEVLANDRYRSGALRLRDAIAAETAAIDLVSKVEELAPTRARARSDRSAA